MVKIFLSLVCVFFPAMVIALPPLSKSPFPKAPPVAQSFPSNTNGIDLLQKAMMSSDPDKLLEFLQMTDKIKPGIIPDVVWEATMAKAKYLGKKERFEMINHAHPDIAFTVSTLGKPFTYLDSVDWVIDKMKMHSSEIKTLLKEVPAKGVLDSLEKRFLAAPEHPVLISDETFLADLLTLKGLNKAEAVAELVILKTKYPDRFKNFKDPLFLKQLEDLEDLEDVLDYASKPQAKTLPPGVDPIKELQKAVMGDNIRALKRLMPMLHLGRPIWEATFVKAKYFGKEDQAEILKEAYPEYLRTSPHPSGIDWQKPFTYLDSVDWVIEKMEMHPTQFKTLLEEVRAKGVLDSLEKRFLQNSEHPALISDETFLADLLALKGLKKDRAVGGLAILKTRYPGRFKNFKDPLFLKQLEDVEDVLDYVSKPQPTTLPPGVDPIKALQKAVEGDNIRALKRLIPLLHLEASIWEETLVKAKYLGKEDYVEILKEASSQYPSGINGGNPFTYLDSVDWIIKKMEMDPTQSKTILKEAQEAMDALEKRFLEGSENPILISDEAFLADLLALKNLNKDGAVSELKILKTKYPDRFKNFKDPLFLTQLDSVFANQPFKIFGDRFSKNKWTGHTQAIRALNPGTPLSGTLEKKDMLVKVLGTEHTLNYRLWKNSEASPQSIVIQVYPGHGGGFSCTPDYPPLKFGDPSILSINLDLWDCKSDIDQSKQLTEQNFKTTHFSYLLGVSQFIAHIAEKYPGAKIYLMGQSFGGFFVTSYALLQSVLENHIPLDQVYREPFAINEFKTLGPNALSKIHGFISTSGAIYYIDTGGLAKPGALKYLSIPGFFSVNYDDDRVGFATIQSPLESTPRGLTELFVNREGAQDYGRDLGETGSLQSTTTRGHFSSDVDPAQMVAIRAFIHRTAANQPQSKLQLEVQDRRRNIYFPPKKNVYFSPRDKKKEQYLSNLSNTQHLIETKRKTDPNFKLSKEELAKHHLEDIEADAYGNKPEEEKLRQATSTKKIWKAGGARVAEDPSSKENVKKRIQIKKEILKKLTNFGLASPPPPPVKIKDDS